MAELTESPVWEEGIYQIEPTDQASGGPDGVANVQARQLANRTSYLRNRDVIVEGTAEFGASESVVIDIGLQAEDQYEIGLSVIPVGNTEGALGDVWIEPGPGPSELTIHHTGEFEGQIRWVMTARRMGT